MDRQYDIMRIEFGILSPDEIHEMSVCKVSSNKLNGTNSVYDDRMGPMENRQLCPTCSMDNKNCPGHFGHIDLNFEIMHPLYFKTIVSFLKCFCYSCSSLLIPREQMQLDGLLRFTSETRFAKILEKVEKYEMCPQCQYSQPKIVFVSTENNIYMVRKKKTETIKSQLTENEIKKIFENIPDEDISILGFDPKKVHPKNLIISVLPVIPPVARPFIIADSVTCDDDLTIQYLEIVKINNHLEDRTISEAKIQKYIQAIKFRIKCLFDNSQEKAKHTNGRPLKGLKKRMAGKDGQLRNNLMGKRVNKSARTVIGPDPTLRLEQMAIPEEVANILTKPVRVARFNIKQLEKLIQDGGANFVIKNGGKTRINLKYAMYKKGTELMNGDVVIREDSKINVDNPSSFILEISDKVMRDGKLLKNVVYPTKKQINLEYGDIVERKLQDRDIVLLNRQPTLHKGSMLAQEIVIRKGKTFRLNLAITKTFNADFDGDEMNIHIPDDPESEAELRFLSATPWNMISAQSTKSNIPIVQDALLSVYLMTSKNKKLSKANFFNIAISCDSFSPSFIVKKLLHIRRVLKELGKKVIALNGRGLFSLLLPNDLIYERKNNAMDKEPVVKIYKGVLYEGAINKGIVGGAHNSLTQILHKEYGEIMALNFINNIQFLANNWILYHGFSLGIGDCIATKTSEIESVIMKCFMEAKGVEETTRNSSIREIKINAALSKARDNGMRIAKQALSTNNNFISTVTSGSKGDYFNIAQITGLLGQQNFSGQRIKPSINKNTRTLPHYPFEDLIEEKQFESRGFIRNSFIHGLNPREFWFHAITGREGVTDTAMKTAHSGYIQRRMVKLAEDIQVKYDGTVRNASGSIYQFQYGQDGLDACQSTIIDGIPQVCDVSRLVDKLNLRYE